MKEAVKEVRPQIEARRHEFTLSIPDEPLMVEGDATRLEQVVANLLTNSAKFTEPGGLIRIELRREAAEAVIRVIDNGVGMAPELLPSIFDLFVQAERSLERAEGGLGLGLTLARRLTELHDGSIEARSPGLGQGSEFIVHARVTVLAEMIRHHVNEEEQRDGMFAKAKASDMDLESLGEQLQARKEELMDETPQQRRAG